MKNKDISLACDICGQNGIRIRKVTEAHDKGKELLIIENIPMISCSKCGESYFTAETLHEIERIKLHRKNLALEKTVSVASFVL